MTETGRDSEMSLTQHLIELRSVLLKSVLAVIITFIALMPFANDLYRVLAHPLLVTLTGEQRLIATDVIAPFLTPIKFALFTAFCIAMPFVLFQLWRFVAPALYKYEKRLAIPLLISSIVLFYGGIAFAYFVVFPLIFMFIQAVAPIDVIVMPDISAYLGFALKLFLAFGIVFETPIATALLILTGIVSSEQLARKRPYIIVLAFTIGMLLTPPDVISQTLLAIPLWLLFELGLLIGKLLHKQRRHKVSPTREQV